MFDACSRVDAPAGWPVSSGIVLARAKGFTVGPTHCEGLSSVALSGSS